MMLETLDVPTNKPKVMFVTDEETREYLETWAEEEGRSISNLVDRIVKAAIKQRKDEQGK
ncbi:ribbon-helix-helix domain-containing protein [Thermoleptolyngbya sp.]